MNSVKWLRRIFLLMTVMAVAAVSLVIFEISDLALSIYERVKRLPAWWFIPYFILISLFSASVLWIFFKVRSFGLKNSVNKNKNAQKPTIETLREKISLAQESGFSAASIESQLNVLEAEIEANEEPRCLEIAFFGKISTGKSSLIRTIIPDAKVEISVIGGSTKQIERYQYQLENLSLTLSDMPGTHLAETVANLDTALLNDARKVHIVCYVMDQDITASDAQSLEILHQWDKPLVAVLNKANRYSFEDRELLREHISSCLPANTPLVLTASSYPRIIRRQSADGKQVQEEVMTKGDASELLQVFAEIEAKRGELGKKQRQSLIELADETLTKQLADFRGERARKIIKEYSLKAMAGGMAAVGPGTDVIIQGYLGWSMVKALGKLYAVPVKEVDVQTLIEQASGKAKTHITLILALTGNVCKAFPGVGTVLGGGTHAVAYGLIFDSLGQAVAEAMAAQASAGIDAHLSSNDVLARLEAHLGRNIENRAIGLVKSAIATGKEQNKTQKQSQSGLPL